MRAHGRELESIAEKIVVIVVEGCQVQVQLGSDEAPAPDLIGHQLL